MTDPVDPIEHLDFKPKCDWHDPSSAKRCSADARSSASWSCGCVMLTCGTHALSLAAGKLARCPIHGGVGFVRKEMLG